MKRVIIAAALVAAATTANADPLVFHNGRLFIPAWVNGVETEALLDSGAEANIVDPAFAAKAKLPEGEKVTMKGSGGESPARVVPDVTIDALGLTLHPEAVVVLDLTEMSGRLIKRPTSVILGREIFDAARLQIDINGGTIRRAKPDSHPSGMQLGLTAHAGIEAIPVSVNGTAASADFDLGNGSDVMVSRPVAERLRLKITGKKPGGGVGGKIMRDTVVLDRLDVAGVTFRNVPASIDDQGSHNDVNVGTSILKNFRITTDFKNRSVWLEPLEKSPR